MGCGMHWWEGTQEVRWKTTPVIALEDSSYILHFPSLLGFIGPKEKPASPLMCLTPLPEIFASGAVALLGKEL